MKTIKIKDSEIEEVIIRPNENIPVSVSYKLLDDTGKLITVKRINIPQNEITQEISNMVTKLLTNISDQEGL